MNREKQIRTIWAIAKNIGFNSDEVHDVVYRETSKESIKQCSDSQLERVINALKYIGSMEDAKRSRTTQKQRKYIKDLEFDLGWSAQPERLRGFIKKYYGVENIDWLTVKQASNLIESLKKMKTRKEEKH